MRFASGARLGPFEILAPLGAGGMGEVYRARDTRLDRTVAIKLLPSELVNAPGRRVERFRHEARVIARITHPNICTLHDVGEDGSAIFLVMEYVDGATLARRLEDGPLPLPLALRTAIGIADALDHAHRHGVVHRDLKPGNIMLTRDSVKLLDFGLAKLKERDEQVPTDATRSARLTEVGTIVGTVPYMAPEQIEGREVDARTDIFSFGVVLYEMVCGRRPFAGDSRASLMAAIVSAEPPSLSSLQPQAPASLERLIRRCLAKDPDDRWQTARDLAAELRWIAEAGSGTATAAPGHHAPAAPRRALGRRRGRCADRRRVCGDGAVDVAQTRRRRVSPVTFRKGAVSSARFTPDGQSFVYSASWEGQPYAAFLGRPGSPDARDLQLKDSRILSISRAGDMAVLFGPQNITHTFGVRTLARIPMAGGARRDMLTGVVDADWIPGTDALAVIRDPGGGRPWTVEFPAGTTVHEARAAWSLRVSPDGSRVAFFEGPVMFGGAPAGDDHGHRQVWPQVNRLAGLGGLWIGVGAVGNRDLVHGRRAPPTGRPHAACRLALGRRATGASRARLARAARHLRGRQGAAVSKQHSNQPACRRPGDTRERDLTWLLASSVSGLSPDGETLIFEDALAAPSGNPMLFRRSVDGSPAVPIGEGSGGALSPDGKWVLAVGENLVLLPTGAGAMVTLPKGNVVRVGRRRVAQRLEAHRLHGLHRRRQAQRLHSGDPGRHSSCDHAGWSGSRRQSGGARRQLRPRSRRRHMESSFRFRAETASRFRRSSLEISRFNGATTADTCIRSTTSREPAARR